MTMPTGTITLQSDKDRLMLSALDDQDGAPVALLPAEDTDAQRWIVATFNDAVIVRSAQADPLFLVARSSDPMSPIVLSRIPVLGQWTVVVQDPGIILQLNAAPLQLAYSLLRIWPPRLALMPSDSGNTITWIAAPVA